MTIEKIIATILILILPLFFIIIGIYFVVFNKKLANWLIDFQGKIAKFFYKITKIKSLLYYDKIYNTVFIKIGYRIIFLVGGLVLFFLGIYVLLKFVSFAT